MLENGLAELLLIYKTITIYNMGMQNSEFVKRIFGLLRQPHFSLCKHTKKKHSLCNIDSFFDKFNLNIINYHYFNDISFTFARQS